MTNKILTQLNKLEEVESKISNLVYDNKELGFTEKQTLFISYFDIYTEHLQSLHLLISKGKYRTGFALVRIFYDTFFRALWVNAYATPEQLEKIRNGKYKFQGMGTIVKNLDNYYTNKYFKYNGNDYFEKFKTDAWDHLCDYTHSGTNQLLRRWSKNEHTEDEILEVIIEVTKTYLLFANILFQIHKYNEEYESVVNISNEYIEDTASIIEKIDDVSL